VDLRLDAPTEGAADRRSARDDLSVLFVLVDTLRPPAQRLRLCARLTTPDRLAAGIRFANVESQSSWTSARRPPGGKSRAYR
jgi:hypothetical protein